MINKLPQSVKIPSENLSDTVKQLYKIFIDNNKKINEIVDIHNNNYPAEIMFRINGTSLECSLDGGTTWQTVTLT